MRLHSNKTLVQHLQTSIFTANPGTSIFTGQAFNYLNQEFSLGHRISVKETPGETTPFIRPCTRV
ncbi:12009_t:CDS:2 [Funneliformis geosporum]|uniref:12009_t:CDS:1 n=1 Tax=Funneliformis geosporum TaxID=1117311 RepID=A0A9W4SV02_9GLOM|nr:12009_t:CDS:2 [Funneliformis geosporum]